MKPSPVIRRNLAAAFLTAAALLWLPQSAAGADPSITALPLAVSVPAEQTSGSAVIKWDGGIYPSARAYLKVGNGEETLFGSTPAGTRTATISIGKPHVFKLYSTPLKTKLLSSVTVSAAHPPPPAPPATGSGNRFYSRSPRSSFEAAQALIRDVRVVASANNVVVSFTGPPNTVPILELCKFPPQLLASRRWAFAQGQNSTAYPVGGDKEKGAYRVDVGSITELQPDTTYFYILNARTDNTAPGAARQQETGKFTTLSQTVKVIFNRILVLNDSDAHGNGELTFHYFANGGGEDGARHFGTSDLDWGEGSHDIHVELVVPDAPDQFPVQVDGYDDDSDPFFGRSLRIRAPLSSPGKGQNQEFNLARDSFDLTQHPGETTSFDFQLKSAENGGDRGDLSFVVFGRVEITRSLPSSPAPVPPASRPPFVLKPRRPRDAVQRSPGSVIARPKNPQDATAPEKPAILKPRVNPNLFRK